MTDTIADQTLADYTAYTDSLLHRYSSQNRAEAIRLTRRLSHDIEESFLADSSATLDLQDVYHRLTSAYNL